MNHIVLVNIMKTILGMSNEDESCITLYIKSKLEYSMLKACNIAPKLKNWIFLIPSN